MSWDEPLEVARRLASCVGATVTRDPGRATDRTVLLLDAGRLGELTDRSAAAVVAVGPTEEATSAGLARLHERVERCGLTVLVATFASDADLVSELPLVIGAPEGSAQLAEQLSAGVHSLLLDDGVPVAQTTADDPPARVCVVSFEAAGMTGGGIGTAASSLAESLAGSGHDVTLLFTGWRPAGADDADERWRAHHAERGISLEFVRPPGRTTVKNVHHPARAAYEVWCWLRAEPPFDVVHVPENMGQGAYAQLAKRQGLAFADTTFVIGTHGSTRWAAEANRVALTRDDFLVNEALERLSVELADVLLGPSRYLHRYMRANGWTLPRRVHVQPYATPTAVRRAGTLPQAVRARSARPARVEAPGRSAAGSGPQLPDELVFFGRLETRKGVATLCDALDLLASSHDVPPFTVTFLGPVAEVLGRPADTYVEERARRWRWPCRVVADLDQAGAAAYLARPGVLAVMPSTVDNAPNTVSEAISLGIPFVASRIGGTGELVDALQRDDHMFGACAALQPAPLTAPATFVDPAPLAELLARRLSRPVAPARPAATTAAVDAAYDRWHRAARRRASTDAPAGGELALPGLAVCLLFDGDARGLRAQLDALHGHEGVEIVVADLRAAPSAPPRAEGATVVRPERAGHAAQARNACAAVTAAELIAVFPPGHVPLPGFAQLLCRIAATGEADVWSWAVLDERDRGDDDDRDAIVHAFVPLPGPAIVGLRGPAFAAGPYAIRSSALAELGGFAADAVGEEADDELLMRAVVAGLRLEVVPEPLAANRTARRWANVRIEGAEVAGAPVWDAAQGLRVARPLAAGGVLADEDAAGLLLGGRVEEERLRALVTDLQTAYESRLADHRRWIDDLEGKAEQWRTDHATLLAEIEATRAETDRLRRINEELSETAAHLAVRTLRSVGRRVRRDGR